jgi:hypothetical protein
MQSKNQDKEVIRLCSQIREVQRMKRNKQLKKKSKYINSHNSKDKAVVLSLS